MDQQPSGCEVSAVASESQGQCVKHKVKNKANIVLSFVLLYFICIDQRNVAVPKICQALVPDDWNRRISCEERKTTNK